jgi:hypothetical protein
MKYKNFYNDLEFYECKSFSCKTPEGEKVGLVKNYIFHQEYEKNKYKQKLDDENKKLDDINK